MNETICPCCGASSPDEAKYCMRCGEPIKCKNCDAGLLANARACIRCGKLVPERESAESRFVAGTVVPPGYNRLTVHQRAESYEYRADFVFSNVVGEQTGTGDFISHLAGFGERAAPSSPIPQEPAQPSRVVEVDGQQENVPQLSPGLALHSNVSGASGADGGITSAPEIAIRNVFSEHDGKLTLLKSDLKAANQKDYTQRLVHAFLYARQAFFNETNTSRQLVYEVTDFAGLARDNVGAYISQDNAVSREGDLLSLKITGLEHARRCLLEIVDQATTGQWVPDGESRAPSKPRKTGKRTESQSDIDIAAIVEHPETRALVQDISHNTISDMSTLDKATVALYGLSKAGQEGEVFYSTIEEYLYRVFHLTVDADTIGRALRRAVESHNKHIVHKEGAGYRITPTGSDYVEATYRTKSGANSPIVQPELAEQSEPTES